LGEGSSERTKRKPWYESIQPVGKSLKTGKDSSLEQFQDKVQLTSIPSYLLTRDLSPEETNLAIDRELLRKKAEDPMAKFFPEKHNFESAFIHDESVIESKQSHEFEELISKGMHLNKLFN